MPDDWSRYVVVSMASSVEVNSSSVVDFGCVVDCVKVKTATHDAAANPAKGIRKRRHLAIKPGFAGDASERESSNWIWRSIFDQ